MSVKIERINFNYVFNKINRNNFRLKFKKRNDYQLEFEVAVATKINTQDIIALYLYTSNIKQRSKQRRQIY